MLPELWDRCWYGVKVDKRALGITTHELLFGFLPFNKNNQVCRPKTANLCFPQVVLISVAEKDCDNQLLIEDVEHSMPSSEAFRNAWFGEFPRLRAVGMSYYDTSYVYTVLHTLKV